MKRVVIRIEGCDYQLTPTPNGKNSCVLCHLANLCLDNAETMPCLDFASDKDWHFEKVNHDTKS